MLKFHSLLAIALVSSSRIPETQKPPKTSLELWAAPSVPCPSTEVTQRQPLKMLPQRFKMLCSFIAGRSRLPANWEVASWVSPHLMWPGQRLSSEWNRNSRPLRVKGIRWLLGQFYPHPPSQMLMFWWHRLFSLQWINVAKKRWRRKQKVFAVDNRWPKFMLVEEKVDK